jgi:catechol 2,3-dioxygenase-like lactoylglutathione lyase family enzyme
VADDFKVLGVNHVTVTAPDELEDETLDWYRSCLGLAQLDKLEGARDRGGWFRAGGQEVHVSIDEHNPHHAAHFALVVSDFDEIIERLRKASSHIEQARPLPGRKRCYTRDPAGNRIELMAYEHTEGD